MNILLRYIFLIRVFLNKFFVPIFTKFKMFNMLSLLVIFNLSKIKKILPKKNIKYKALVLTKSVGIDDLIISQKNIIKTFYT